MCSAAATFLNAEAASAAVNIGAAMLRWAKKCNYIVVRNIYARVLVRRIKLYSSETRVYIYNDSLLHLSPPPLSTPCNNSGRFKGRRGDTKLPGITSTAEFSECWAQGVGGGEDRKQRLWRFIASSRRGRPGNHFYIIR